MQAIQLELDLWAELDLAAAAPEVAHLDSLWQALESAIAPLPQQLQLQTAAEGILRIAQVYASRSDWLLSSWEEAHNPEGPILGEDMLSGLVRQTMTLDLAALIEPPAPEHRHRQPSCAPYESIAGMVDKAALLQVLQEIEAESAEAETAADPFRVAHSEDIPQWAGAIAAWMEQRCELAAVPLNHLQQALGMPMVEVWLGLLLKGQDEYELEQRGDFYSPRGIWVRNRRPATLV